jgi:fermentation-respiration switch protein FrsA (DUF1100 family)
MMGRLLVLPLASVVILIALLWLTQRRMIYLPYAEIPSPAEVGLPQAERVAFATDDGVRLNGWFVPAAARPTGDVVIVFNGNAGNRAFRADLGNALARLGFATLLFDYRGYGENPGSPSEDGLRLDALAARRYVESRHGIDPQRISYFGESLGAGVAVGLALERRPRALILRSPFTSLVDTGRYHFPYLPVNWLLRDRFPSVDRISRIGCPLLIVAAAHDTIVPSDQSRRLFEVAQQPKRLLIIENVDHNDEALMAGPQVTSAVAELLRELK